MNQVYILDANICINLPVHYPDDLFPSLWKLVEDLLISERAILPQEIFAETGQRTNTFPSWFHSIGAQTTYLTAYAGEHTALARVLKDCRITQVKGQDPILVASALELLEEGKSPVVVSAEKTSRGSYPLKVPDMCSKFSIECIKFFDFLRREKFQI